jgi:hypothetical protein
VPTGVWARTTLVSAMSALEEYFRHRQWSVGLVRAPIHRFLEAGFRPHVEWIHVPSRDEYFADPFGIVQDGLVRVLCERYNRKTSHGTLAAFDWPAEGHHAEPEKVLSLGSHVSYPFLLHHEGRLFCVPETFESAEIGLYEAEAYPHRWSKVGTLVAAFPGVDTTVFQFDGRWWMTATRSDAPDRRLYVWFADDLEGPWRPHPKNPVKDTPASARPGGTPFAWNGKLYRPAQDCSETYGGRVAINEVDRLTPEAFEEHVVTYVEPDPTGPYRLGLHTLSSVGEVTLIDGLRHVFSRSAFRQRAAVGLAALNARGRGITSGTGNAPSDD